MPTLIKSLAEDFVEDYEIFNNMFRSTFLDGECYAFAIALHRGLGWPMVGLKQGEVVRHAAVRSPAGELHDARGFISEEEFGRPFDCSPPYVLCEVSEKDLRAIRIVHSYTIDRARRMAEVWFPMLPWKDGGLVARISAFADELETLSRKHGFWIRAPFPAAPPVLAPDCGSEKGYALQPLSDGLTYAIDRYFYP